MVLNSIEDFIKSPVFISGYWIVFLIFVMFRLFSIKNTNVDVYFKIKFFLWAFLQFICLLIVIYITFFFIKLGIVNMITNMITWFQLLIKKRRNKKLSQRIGNFFTRLGLIIMLFITGWFLQFLSTCYVYCVYYFIGIAIGYTTIG